ncbi:helix-turn-helix domain-containing protein [Parerythrobacter jejuensis]|uniref:Helix-turn-helix domain-containing protein n=1 Tax=Parerythrobacter jejuensis TaxID=795812 RepID=A0A845AYH8_9SPHN|nr:AraC family transcriptional regulator [Parerythrobacter jejuensis]MXP30796.1 helix-turn-helix domain-containing protein [Parerythrobacter jejuensis]MXP33556.1 helix-turn-helix domain-containing protein [Parerythrobacter jejuensis]
MGSRPGAHNVTTMPSQAEYPVFVPRTGATPDGVPLSVNRAPAADLEPWISRVMVAIADAPTDVASIGYLCNDAGYIRTAIDAHWTTYTAEGALHWRNQSFLCGQHSVAMKLTSRGPIKVSGIMLKPGAMRVLWGINDGALLDKIRPLGTTGTDDHALTGLYENGITPEEWLERIEDWLRSEIAARGAPKPERIAQQLEAAAFADPNMSPGDFCEREGIAPRRMQRICKRDFGLSPKQVLRRARTLDLAARMCGVADKDEEQEFLLRYFDQSHQIRDFTALFGRSPQQFMNNRQPLLTLSLEIRQARRLELLNRIAPDAIRPWMREPFRPLAA